MLIMARGQMTVICKLQAKMIPMNLISIESAQWLLCYGLDE